MLVRFDAGLILGLRRGLADLRANPLDGGVHFPLNQVQVRPIQLWFCHSRGWTPYRDEGFLQNDSVDGYDLHRETRFGQPRMRVIVPKPDAVSTALPKHSSLRSDL
jgi:hypothetical protein